MKYFFVLLLAVLSTNLILAQSGTVKDQDGFGISNVEVKNTNTGATTLTDFDGNFEIDAAVGDKINFYTPDFAEKSIVSTGAAMNVVLEPMTLTEVVVVGYGAQEKELVSAAYSKIDSEAIIENSPTRIDQAIQGKATGVQVTNTSGAPGAAASIRIRGITTNGDNSPLVIMDGINLGRTDLSVIDPNDVESIDIIKDAAAAIYGVQGANGVIFITTKSGKKGKKTLFSYNGYYGIQEPDHLLNMMDGSEYAGYVNEIDASSGNPISYPNFQSLGKGTDWQAQIFDTSYITNHNFSANGGGEKLTYALSGSYLLNNGTIDADKSNYQRYTLRGNFGINLTQKLKLNTSILYTNEKRRSIAAAGRGGVLYYAYNASPLTSVYDGSNGGGPSNGFSYIGQNSIEMVNPLAVLYNTHNIAKVDRFTGKVEGIYDFNKNFSFTSRYNFNIAEVQSRAYFPLSYYGPGKVVNTVGVLPNNSNAYNLDRNNNGIRDVFSTVYQSTENFSVFQFENFFNYNLNLSSGHHFDFLLGTSLLSEPGSGTYAAGYMTQGRDNWNHAFLTNSQSFIPDEEYQTPSAINSAKGAKWDYRLSSIYGRVQYDYKSKYLFSAMLRSDGSSRFGKNNRYGYFPSLSAGWNVNKENFFTSSTFNVLKVRGSWGIIGNDKIPDFAYVGLFQQPPGEASYPFDNSLIYGNAYGRIANPDLQWEENHTFNIGFETALWNEELGFTFDYYQKRTKNLLLDATPPGISGIGAPGSRAPVINAGTVENKGIDMGITFNKTFSSGFQMNASYSFTYIKNKVLEVTDTPTVGGLFGLSQQPAGMRIGDPIGAYYGLVADGIFQNQAELDAAPDQPGAEVGDIRYKDLNGDGIIDLGGDTDIGKVGNPIPDYIMSLNLGFNYKNFDFSLTLYGTIGNEIVRSYERFEPLNNKLAYYLDRWTGEGTSNTIPRAANTGNNIVFSSFYVEDGTFMRIQNIQVGYNMGNWLKNSGISKARIYFSINNLHTFTKYMGYTPEVNNNTPVGAGFDYGQYPLSRTFITGLTLNF